MLWHIIIAVVITAVVAIIVASTYVASNAHFIEMSLMRARSEVQKISAESNHR